MDEVRLGTRGSQLALAQSSWVREQLSRIHPGVRFTLKVIRTTGDKVSEWQSSRHVGAFVKEIEEALLAEEIEIGVHSLKDVPSRLPEGLCIGAVPPRATPGDALISRDRKKLAELPKGARIGTASVRRKAQLLHHRPDLSLEDLRGNLDTRLRKLGEGMYDAIVVAAAGVRRLGRESEITEAIPVDVVLPAAGQGALALEIREADSASACISNSLNDPTSAGCVAAERAVSRELDAGCRTPLGVLCVYEDRFSMRARLCTPDGSTCVEASAEGTTPEAAAAALLARLRSAGAERILEEVRRP